MLAHYRARAAQLEAQEKQLHESLHPDVEAVVASKRILLFGEMLRDAGSPDSDLAGSLAAGFPLVGQLPCSGVFAEDSSRTPALPV
eukprot:10101387-Alexandrium_andersonii.AAC.1